VRSAFDNNPSLKAARLNWKASLESYRSATALPDPQLMGTYFPRPIETRLGPQDWNITLSQMVPFPGTLASAGKVVSAKARVAQIRFEMKVRDVAVGVAKSALELWYVRRAIEIAKGQRELVENLRSAGEGAAAAGRTGLREVVKVQSQLAQLLYDRTLLEELERSETANLNALLNRPPQSPIGELLVGAPAPLAIELEPLTEVAEQSRDEVKLARAMQAVADASYERVDYSNYPSMKFGLFYAGIGEPDVPSPPPDAGDDAFGVQMGISIPLWRGKNAGRIEGARAKRESAVAASEAKVNATRSLIYKLYFKVKNAERLITLYRDELLPQALSSVENAEVWFREGEGTLSDYAEAQSALYNFRLSLARARTDYGKVVAELEGLVGRNITAAPVGQEATP
jgi:outer membrane protein TolC